MQKIQKFENDKNLYWGFPQLKRDISLEETIKLYEEDFINFNLKNLFLNKEIGFIPHFLPISILEPLPNVDVSTNYSKDPFVTDLGEKRINLAKSILKKGTYFPFLVQKNNNKFIVLEGNNRYNSLKIALDQGLIDNDFKIFCIIIPRELLKLNQEKKLNNPVKGRLVLEQVFGPKVLHDKEYLKQVLYTIKSEKGKIVDKYLIEYEIDTFNQMLYNFSLYPALFLRDLFYKYKENIIPSPIFNNEEYFYKWYNKVNIIKK